MSWKRSAAKGAIAGASALVALTRARAAARAERANVSHPPEGQLIEVDGRRLHVVDQGEGQPLVLIHGASGSSRDFTLSLSQALVADGFRVLAFDRPGLGHSEALAPSATSLADQARHLSRAAAQLGAPSPLVLGHSYGGSVAMAWGLNHAASGLLTIGAPSMPWQGRIDPWYRANAHPLTRRFIVPTASAYLPRRAFDAQVAGVFAPELMPENYAEHLGADLTMRPIQLSENIRQINILNNELQVLSEEWKRLDLPFEILHGEMDGVVPAQFHSVPLARRLPSARLNLLPGAGHMPHHTRPDVVRAALQRLRG